MKLPILTLSLILLSSVANAQLAGDFKQIDTNNTGYIEKQELVYFVKGSMNAQTKEVFTVLDDNGDGVISREEYMTFYKKTQNDKSGVSKLEQKFKEIDTNGDGQLTEAEITVSNTDNADDNTSEMFSLMDTDADSKVSEKEFGTFFNMMGQILGGGNDDN